MKKFIQYTLGIGIVFSILSVVWGAKPPARSSMPEDWLLPPASPPVVDDSAGLKYPLKDRHADKYNEPGSKSPLYLKDPSNISDQVEYDPKENQYNINENIGSLFYRNPTYMTFDEFKEHEFDNSTRQYWRQRASEEDKLQKKTFAPKITINSEAFERIFGSNTIDIRPQGSAELIFAINNSKNQNPALPERQRSITTFDFRERIQMNVTANIGDKMKLGMNYNTEAIFEFDNRLKLEYTGHEDDIIKKIEAGNVSLPLNSQLIQGSQSLFGLKTQLQFGRMMVTGVYTQQKGKSQTINAQGGAQTQQFDMKGDQYEANRHFFLSQAFRDNYETALRDINQIRSSINITKIEIWVRNTTSTRANDATRNLVAVAEIGEGTNLPPSIKYIGGPPDNLANDLFSKISTDTITRTNTSISASQLSGLGLTNGRDFIIQENARLLAPSEYTVNYLLGYISLNSELAQNQILAVAYEYTQNGKVYHVGELSTQSGITGSKALFVKLLRSTTIDPSFFTWDLMMKNIYNIGGYQIKSEQFRLDVLYQNDATGSFINYIPAGCKDVNRIPLLRLLGLDKLNSNGDPQHDGVFDYKEGTTINSNSGRIIFPVLEPFGTALRSKFCGDTILASQYVYQALYDTTRVIAQQQAEKNKFSLHGSYQSSSGSDIPLNAVNVPQGSVKVTAGGVPLKENVDYTVDYTLGRVKIINDAYLKSNTPIQVSLESQSLFNIQTKTMWGTRFDYNFNKDLQVGATVLHLSERPITQKVNYGDEPISNTILGADGNYRTDSRFLTNLLNQLPFYHTKETSTITMGGEVATLFPGHSNAIGAAGTSYIDDFEGAITPYDIKNPGQWSLASTPQLQKDIFPEDYDSLINGYNRAKLAWYYVDNIFQTQSGNTPANIDKDEMSNNYVRDVQETEIFPNKSSPYGPRSIICTNLAFYPTERGPYNYDAKGLAGISSGVDKFGALNDPRSRWGGVMRRIETTDFQNANIEFLQFWVMDPFADDSPNDGSGGDLYVDLGDLSEDVLRDNHKCFENGLYDPSGANPPKSTIWGKYPDENLPQIGYNFDFDPANRAKQDIGLDGLSDGEESSFYNNFLADLAAIVGAGSSADSAAKADPSSDDWSYFQSNTYNAKNVGALERYKKYNGMEGNSPTSTVDGYLALGNQYPDYEDLNRDFTLNTSENYTQYRMNLRPSKMVIGQNYITDIVTADVRTVNGKTKKIKWYQLKIPINAPQKIIGSPSSTYVPAIRMFMRGFNTPVILRFARMELLRGEWRKYDQSLVAPGELEPVPDFPGATTFDISYVNIEENSSRQPVNYVLPPGIERVRDVTTTQLAQLNEQSLSMKVCHLKDGDSRAAYKTTQLDIRTYKKLQMYIHAESNPNSTPLKDGDMTVFIRLGGDFVDNYYEYEVPLYVTAPYDNNPAHVWPLENNLEIILDELVNLKTQRNNSMATDPAHYNLLTPYPPENLLPTGLARRITVKGSPNLSNVRTIMIGLRNAKDANGKGPEICGEVWVNELRLTEFDEDGGWAATARVQAKLADLGNATLVGNRSTIGWGSIEKKVNERDKSDKISYNFLTNLELGKFLPEKTGIKIPFFFEYAEQWINPQFNPLDPDVIFAQSLENAPNDSVKKAVKHASQDYTQRKSLNFTNVKKTKTGKSQKSHFYDVENLNATYAYTEMVHRDYNTDRSFTKTHQGILGYNFNNSPKAVEPFKKTKFLSSPFLKLIKDFNFYYAPSSLSFRAGIDRSYSETQLRNNTGFSDFIIEPTFVKTYKMKRSYGLNWDLTKSLKFDFNADVEATIDEPPGRIDTKEKKDSLYKNLRVLGRVTRYHHIGNLTYTLPLNKIPLVDWIAASAKYGVDYGWTTGALWENPVNQVIEINSFKNTIQNSQSISYNANLNMTSLYNKVPYLKNLNKPKPPPPPKAKPAPKPKMPLDSLEKAKQKAIQDSIKKARPGPLAPVFKGLANLLTSIKTISGTYTETNGTLLPGFDPRPRILGMNGDYQNALYPGSPSSNAPGWAFIMGSQADVYKGTPHQHRKIIDDAAKYHWLTADTGLNVAYATTHLQNFNGRIGIEPIKNFKIDVTFNRNYALNHHSYYHVDPLTGQYKEFSKTESGNFSISYLTWNTAFVKDGSDYSNANFENFKSYLLPVSQILGSENPYSRGPDTLTGGFKNGYGNTQSEVLGYAFQAAYTGKKITNKLIERFPKIPMPNWRITYDGLSRMKPFQSFLQSFNISHGYRSTYNVNSYNQNLLFESDYEGNPTNLDTIHNFIPQYDLQQVSISEQFAPLIGIDMTFKNSLQARFDIKRDRTVGLGFANIQITEVRGIEYTFGTGYKIRNFKAPFVKQTKGKTSSDLNLKADFSYRQNTTLIRKLIENASQPSAGSTTLSIKLSADYNINERFNVKVFADKIINEPFVSTSFPTSNLNAGFSLRFTLAQ